jgi:HK97 family phage prohead protease
MNYQDIAHDQLARSKAAGISAQLASLAGNHKAARHSVELANAHLELARRSASGMAGGLPTCAIGNQMRCEFKFLDYRDGTFEAYASVWRAPDDKGDCVGDRILRGAFEQDLKARGDERPLLFQHEPDLVIGRATRLREDSKGLRFIGKLDRRNTLAMEIRDALESKVLSELSIGFVALDSKRPTRDSRIISKIELDEISVVTAACDWLATVVEPPSL